MLAEAHHLIIARNQQRTRPKPRERAGNAYGGIADERGQPDGGGKPHDKLDHAGEEGRTAVLHALDGGAVDGEQSEQKVKRCDNCKVDIGIMINFRFDPSQASPLLRLRGVISRAGVSGRNDFPFWAYFNSRCLERSSCMKKKIWISLAAAGLLGVMALPTAACAEETAKETVKESGKESEKEEIKVLTEVTLNEVAHSIFYAPQYVAIENGYFEEEGIDLTLVTGFGADKVMTALLSGEAEIGFMGSEASIYTYSGGAADAPVNFAQLTQRAGNFLVAREEMPDFEWTDLAGEEVLGGRKGGVHISM